MYSLFFTNERNRYSMGRSKSTKNKAAQNSTKNSTKDTTKNRSSAKDVIPDEQERRDGPGGE